MEKDNLFSFTNSSGNITDSSSDSPVYQRLDFILSTSLGGFLLILIILIIWKRRKDYLTRRRAAGITKMETDISEILPFPSGLYLSSRPHPPGKELEDYLRSRGITAILDLTTFYSPHYREPGKGRNGMLIYSPRVNPWSEAMGYLNIPVYDLANVDFNPVFAQSLEFIHTQRLIGQRNHDAQSGKLKSKVGGGVLVHCEAGMSRSPTVVVAYLVQYMNMSLAQAFTYVRSCRQIQPNYGFALQLIAFAEKRSEVENSHVSDDFLEEESRDKDKDKGEKKERKMSRNPSLIPKKRFQESASEFLCELFLIKYPAFKSLSRETIKMALSKYPGDFETPCSHLEKFLDPKLPQEEYLLLRQQLELPIQSPSTTSAFSIANSPSALSLPFLSRASPPSTSTFGIRSLSLSTQTGSRSSSSPPRHERTTSPLPNFQGFLPSFHVRDPSPPSTPTENGPASVRLPRKNKLTPASPLLQKDCYVDSSLSFSGSGQEAQID